MKKLIALTIMSALSLVSSPNAEAYETPDIGKQINRGLRKLNQVPGALNQLPALSEAGTWQLFECTDGPVANFVDLPGDEQNRGINGRAVELTASQSDTNGYAGAKVTFGEVDSRRNEFQWLSVFVKGEESDLDEIFVIVCFKINNTYFPFTTQLTKIPRTPAGGGWFNFLLTKSLVNNNEVKSGRAVLRAVSFSRPSPTPSRVLIGRAFAEFGSGRQLDLIAPDNLVMNKGKCGLDPCPR